MKLHEHFLKLKAAVEISIDFSEDVGEAEAKKILLDSFALFMKTLHSLHSRTTSNVSSLLSPEVVLVGQTNAGKSSLFNLLLKHGRSIVSPIAGTTRDYVSEHISIGGTSYNLVDTAGIRESSDVIENIGIDRTFKILNHAFFKILIINPFETNPDYLNKISNIEFDFLILSHFDRPDFNEKVARLNLSKIKASFAVSASFNSGPIEPEGLSGPIEPILKNFIEKKFKSLTANNPILLERHRASINKIYYHAQELYTKINPIDDIAVLSSEINILSHYLSELVGIISPEDVLDSIFSNFCIGK
jgi:tRNA modification GTPase